MRALQPVLCAIALVVHVCPPSCAAAAEQTPPCVLELRSGDFVRGKLIGISKGEVRWQSPFMVEPLRFALNRVSGIVTPPQDTAQQAKGPFVFELTSNGNQLYGDLVSVGRDAIEIESSTMGRLKLLRAHVRRIARVGKVQRTYPVPRSLEDWTISDAAHWRTDKGNIVTETGGAWLFADVNLPAKARIEIDLQYVRDGNPLRPLRGDLLVPNSTFAVHFGTTAQEASHEAAFSIETWGHEIVAQRRSEKVADVAGLGNVGPGSLQYVIYLDRTSGQMLVHNQRGKKLGQIQMPAAGVALDGKGITIVNRRGPLRLKRLDVSDWSGIVPADPGQSPVSIVVKDDTLEAGAVRVDGNKLLLKKNDDTVQHDLADLQAIDFRNRNVEVDDPVSLTWSDGTRLSGTLVSANGDGFELKVAATQLPLKLPLSGVRSVDFASKTPSGGRLSSGSKREGTLELMDTRLKGWLVESRDPDAPDSDAETSCLVWRSPDAKNAATLKRDLNGRIRYVDAKPVIKQPTRAELQRQQLLQQRGLIIFNEGGRPRIRRKNADMEIESQHIKHKLAGVAVHLRSGDTIPCSVTAIDRDGIRIRSKLTDKTHIPHTQIKAAQLSDMVAMPSLSEKKRDRFLTLPRMQRNLPPQHLLFSQKGDILRGSVVAMSDMELDLEVRLDSHRIPRKRLSAIVWLHEDELESDDKSAATDEREDDPEAADPDIAEDVKPEDDEADGMLLQVVGAKGNSRFTFHAKSFSNETVFGESEILGNVHARLSDIDHLQFGPFINRAARSLPYHRWRLKSARDPKYVTDDGSGQTSPGTESALVGQPAPEVKLPVLGGGVFRVADHRGKCLVLDFWASWCGPCLQVMPKVDEVVKEFADKDVRLFAVNLEETADQVNATLERRELLDLPVVLDRDGVAGARYEATALPQTVVIDPEGKIIRVFVGNTRDLEEQLRKAIEEALGEQPE